MLERRKDNIAFHFNVSFSFYTKKAEKNCIVECGMLLYEFCFLFFNVEAAEVKTLRNNIITSCKNLKKLHIFISLQIILEFDFKK